MKLLLIFVTITVVAMASGQNSDEQLKAANDQFTAKFTAEVTKLNPGKSVIMSAYSVLTPLAQLSLVTDGGSHDELLSAIGMPNDESTKKAFAAANKKLRSIKGVDLKTASRIYIPEKYELNDNFNSVSREVFDSTVKNIDFKMNVAAAREINTWVEDHTNKKIKDLVSADSLDYTTRAVLVNAIYFKGTWKEKFNVDDTKDRDFWVSKDRKVQVPTMYAKKEFLYGDSKELDAKLLRLPYEGEEASMLIVLPNQVDGLPALQQKLKDPQALKKAVENMWKTEVNVYLPKFKIETTTDLAVVLKAIGVRKIFSHSEANINRLLKRESELFVSEAKQKAFIEVNEEGAEAAAANEFGIVFSSLVISDPITFNADHPFVFALSEGKNALFTGVFNN